MTAKTTDAVADPKSIWDKYLVEFHFYDHLCSSVPANPEMIAAWIEARAPKALPPGGKTIPEINEEVLASLAEGEETPEEQYEKTMLVFQRHNGALVMRSATVRAHIKDCSRQISSMHLGKIKGEKAFSTRAINGIYLDPKEYWLPILRRSDDAGAPGNEVFVPVLKPDGIMEKPVHARGPRGIPINALKSFEYINEPMIRFTLLVLRGSLVESDLETIFTYGGVHGYAGERGDGEGRYYHTIKNLTEETDGGKSGKTETGKAVATHG
jgi:hypothetical protein